VLISAIEIGSALVAVGALVVFTIRWWREGRRDLLLPFM
jgi:hypothetical protein